MITYAITFIVYLVLTVAAINLAVFSFIKNWGGFWKRLFTTYSVFSMLLYPILMHEYAIITYYWFKFGCPGNS